MDKNRGVYAKKDIEGGVVIGDYLGKIVSRDEEDELKHGTYYMTYSNEATIYADPSEPGVHIVNHSCMPNCAMVEYKTHILYYTLRKIFKGEELTVKYDLGIPDESCNPCTHQCYCKTVLCTGTTHSAEDPSSSYLDDVNDDEMLKPGQKMTPLTKYPKKIRDSVIDNIYANLKQKAFVIEESFLPPLTVIRKFIRETGRPLFFIKLNIYIYGVHHNFILTKLKKPRE